MTERLQKILARAGMGSRRQCEALIGAGRVTVDGQTAELGMSVQPDMVEIRVDGSRIKVPVDYVYIVLNKPPGFLSSLKSQGGNPTVLDLVPDVRRVYPVGRLDLDSEGLLLLTDDGDLTNLLTHPRYGHEKEYLVQLDRTPDKSQIRDWTNGVILKDGVRTQPAEVTVVEGRGGPAWVRVIIKEGRKRQIRETARSLGLGVKRLIRVRLGPLQLADLQVGEWRMLTDDERVELQKLKQMA